MSPAVFLSKGMENKGIRRWDEMTLNILFFTITIKKRKKTKEEILNQEFIEQIYEQNKDRQYSLYRPF